MPEGRASGGLPDDSAVEWLRGVPASVADRRISTGRPLALGEVDVNPLYRQIASRIREAILRGDVEPGARLPTERKLAETFRVSRTSIREALRELEAQGLISPSRAAQARRVASGLCHEAIRDALASVLVLQQVSFAHLLQLCGAVEAVAVRVAAEATVPVSGGLHEAERAHVVMQASVVSLSDYFRLDARFHTALAAASGNPAFVAVTCLVRDALNRLVDDGRNAESSRQADLAALAREDECILSAVRDGDGERAVAACAAHLHHLYAVGDARRQ